MQPFTLPHPLSQLFSILPQYPHSLAFAQALNLALGETLRSAARQAYLPAHKRCADCPALYPQCQRRQRKPCRQNTRPHHQRKAYDFIQLALRKEDPDTLFFSRRLLMEGDTEQGLLVKNTLDALELPPLDWRMLLPARMLDGIRARVLHG